MVGVGPLIFHDGCDEFPSIEHPLQPKAEPYIQKRTLSWGSAWGGLVGCVSAACPSMIMEAAEDRLHTGE